MKIIIAVITWLLLALVVGKYRLLATFAPPFPQVVLFGLTLILLLLCWKLSVFRNWVFNLDIRVLVLVHLSRFIGIYFLILHSQGELPYAFAVPGGLGDIAVATTAIFVSLISSASGVKGFRILLIWNVFGLLDILFVIAAAGRLGMADPGSINALTRLPLSLLPTFLVPIIIFTHIIIFVRLVKIRSQF
ncbi:MAG TPA: hypothetical protein VI935_03490 [Thermodesulfobacteriota bacterium]|nr:hypothetical protein [Thermodesulfobacteriota bacterium]